MDLFRESIRFEWDAGNRDKNWVKHSVANHECEETFFDPHKRILGGREVLGENRILVVGKTKVGRLLFVVFTIRRNWVRVISARDLNKNEKSLYEKKT